jgi:hypothetical protein
MIQPLNWWQKAIAYGSLVFVLLWFAFGTYVIWLVLAEG